MKKKELIELLSTFSDEEEIVIRNTSEVGDYYIKPNRVRQDNVNDSSWTLDVVNSNEIKKAIIIDNDQL